MFFAAVETDLLTAPLTLFHILWKFEGAALGALFPFETGFVRFRHDYFPSIAISRDM